MQKSKIESLKVLDKFKKLMLDFQMSNKLSGDDVKSIMSEYSSEKELDRIRKLLTVTNK